MNLQIRQVVYLLLVVASPVLQAADVNFTQTNGNWNVDSNWSSGTVPGSTDNALINFGRTATIDSAVPATSRIRLGSGSAAMGTLVIANGGSIVTSGITMGDTAGGSGNIIISGGGLTISGTVGMNMGNNAGAAASSLTITSGSFDTSGTVWVGSQATATVNQTGGIFKVTDTAGIFSIGSATVSSASYKISGTGNLQWSDTLRVFGNNNLEVSGSQAALTALRSTGTGLILSGNSQTKFTLDSTGVASVNLGTSMLSLSGGAILTIDGSAYTGPSVAQFTLFSFSALQSGSASSFGTVNLTGFDSLQASVIYNSDSIVLSLASVPEPGSASLTILGGLLFSAVLLNRSRSKKRNVRIANSRY